MQRQSATMRLRHLLNLLAFIVILLKNIITDIKTVQFNKIRFFGGFADEKTPFRRAGRVRAPRGAVKIADFDKRR
jgi:hypothetical protein